MRALRLLLAASVAFVALCLAVFGTPWTAAALAVLAALLARGSRLLLLAPVLLLGWKLPLHEYADRVEELDATEDWSTRDRAGLWVLNLGMAGAGAALGMPEVALETTLLVVPGLDTVRLPSDFAMGSPAVRRAIRRQVATLPARGSEPVPLSPRQVSWRYSLDDSARVALALNPVTLSGTAHPADGGWLLHLEGRVPVRYPDGGYRLRLFSLDGRSIDIEEGHFARLQRDGWFHPYDMVWTWTVHSADPELSDDDVGRGWAEAVVVGLSTAMR